MLKPGLQLKMSQHLALTPQLRQALRLLQLSSLELQQEVEQALNENPLLEAEEDGEQDSAGMEPVVAPESLAAAPQTELEETAGETDLPETGSEPEDAGTDWEDTGDWEDGAYEGRSPGSSEEFDPLDLCSTPQSLHADLREQARLLINDPRTLAQAWVIIDAIDDDGYLRTPLADLSATCAQLNPALVISPEALEQVLYQVQTLEPSGIAARNLAECLQLQLQAQLPDVPYRNLALRIVNTQFVHLARQDYTTLQQQLGVSQAEMQGALNLIRHMHPRPGRISHDSELAPPVPDLLARKRHGIWVAELNPALTPHLRVNAYYASLLRNGLGSQEAHYLKTRLQEARWFIKSLHNRHETLLRVGSMIVDAQQAFFEHGPAAMKPLVLRDIAQRVGLHESTVSRVTSNKYLLAPHGLLELKYFFSSHVQTDAGGTCSATAIRALIRQFITTEQPLEPLSDSDLVKRLGQQGIKVARRTVAKYREMLAIPPSNERKQAG